MCFFVCLCTHDYVNSWEKEKSVAEDRECGRCIEKEREKEQEDILSEAIHLSVVKIAVDILPICTACLVILGCIIQNMDLGILSSQKSNLCQEQLNKEALAPIFFLLAGGREIPSFLQSFLTNGVFQC